MKRNNRRRYSRIHTVDRSVIIVVVLLFFICVGGGLVKLSLGRCNSNLNADISKLEREYDAMCNDLRREEAAWAELVVPEQLELALQRNGIHMELPHGEQIVNLAPKAGERGNGMSSPPVYVSNR